MVVLFLFEKFASAVLKALLSVDHITRKSSRKTNVKLRYLTSYPQVVNVLLEKHAPNETIAKTESVIIRLVQPARVIPLQYAEELFPMTLCCRDVYEKYVLNEILIKRLDRSLR